MRKIRILLMYAALGCLIVACNTAPQPDSRSDSTQTSTPTSTNSVFTFNGKGSQNTQLFTVRGPIEIDYQCEPSIQGNFTIVIYNKNGDGLGAPVNIDCNSGITTGAARSNASDTIYLSITAMGNWSITVKEKPNT